MRNIKLVLAIALVVVVIGSRAEARAPKNPNFESTSCAIVLWDVKEDGMLVFLAVCPHGCNLMLTGHAVGPDAAGRQLDITGYAVWPGTPREACRDILPSESEVERTEL